MAKEGKQKTKRPTALKRDTQNLKRRLINKTFKSRIRTAMRSFESALEAKNNEEALDKLNGVYSVMDQAAKRGIYKRNKADRLKARAAQKIIVQPA